MTAPKPQALTFFGEPIRRVISSVSVFTDENKLVSLYMNDGYWMACLSGDYVEADIDRNPHQILRQAERAALAKAIHIIELAGGWVEGVDEEYLR